MARISRRRKPGKKVGQLRPDFAIAAIKAAKPAKATKPVKTRGGSGTTATAGTKGPSPRAYARANANASFKRPGATGPGKSVGSKPVKPIGAHQPGPRIPGTRPSTLPTQRPRSGGSGASASLPAAGGNFLGRGNGRPNSGTTARIGTKSRLAELKVEPLSTGTKTISGITPSRRPKKARY